MKIQWKQFSPGVWTACIGSDMPPLTGYASITPSQALWNFPDQPFFDKVACDLFGEYTVFRIPIQDHEQIFGAGLQFKKTIRFGNVLHLRCDHYGKEDNGRTHAPVPFHVSTENYGLFIDTPEEVSYYFHTSQRKEDKTQIVECDRGSDPSWQCCYKPYYMEIAVRTDSMKIVLFRGDNIKDCVARFNLFCGGGCLPPKWGLGFWHRTGMYMTQSEIFNIIKDYQDHHFPLSVLGLEPGWQNASYPCSYVWSKEHFPEPKKMISELKNQDIRVNVWVNPFISEKCPLYQQLQPYSASHLVWGGIIPDYTMELPRQLIGDYLTRTHLDYGVSGYKLDESDGYDRYLWPNHTVFPSGCSGSVYRNLCGLMFQRLTNELYRARNERTYGLTRSTNAGGTLLPYVIFNDNYDFRDFLCALVNSGFIGTLWCPEVRSAGSPNEWLRRIQLAALSPMLLLNAWADQSMPWMYPETEDAVLAAVKLRESLIPYLYTAFARYHFEGIPPFRSVFMDYGYFLNTSADKGKLDSVQNPYESANVADIPDQFMFGESLMAAPFSPEQKTRTIIFPPGKWYDFYTGKFVSDGGVLEYSIGANDALPIFAPDGTVIPFMKDNKLEVRHFGDKPGEFRLYEDDGETLNYEKGEFCWTILRGTPGSS